MESRLAMKKGKRSIRELGLSNSFRLNEFDLEAAHVLMTLANSHIPPTSPISPIPPISPIAPISQIPLISPISHIASKRKRMASSKLDEYIVEREESKVERSYSCRRCGREFRSFQALGGHSTSCFYKLMSSNGGEEQPPLFHSFHASKTTFPKLGSKAKEKRGRVQRCPVCDRVFSTAQALGGHRRSHKIYVPTVEPTTCALEDEHENSNASCSRIDAAHHFHPTLGLRSTDFHTDDAVPCKFRIRFTCRGWRSSDLDLHAEDGIHCKSR